MKSKIRVSGNMRMDNALKKINGRGKQQSKKNIKERKSGKKH
jgi:hypothetical protein